MNNPRYAYSIPEAAEVIGIKTSKLYELIAEGQIIAKKIGSRTIILDETIRDFLANLPDAETNYTKRNQA